MNYALPQPLRAAGEIYNFVDESTFQTMNTGGKFIEWVRQYGGLYGTTISGVVQALNTEKPLIIWRGEIRGWPKVKRWIEQNQSQVGTYSIFVLPAMPITEYGIRLAQKRGLVDALKNRIPKALSEIAQAPPVSDAILLNPPDETGIPHRAISAMNNFLHIL